MFELERGDLSRISKASLVPIETVRRYLAGGNIGVIAARAIDAAYEKMKPAKAASKSKKGGNRKRRVSGGTRSGVRGAAISLVGELKKAGAR